VIVADTSALFAIIAEEPDAEAYLQRIAEEDLVLVGAPTAFALILVAWKKLGEAGVRDARMLLQRKPIVVVDWTSEQLAPATDALLAFNGRPARLNYGDCMSYAVAKAAGVPLLFKGDDFGHTDVAAALG
jgi:ribonuclease VapC